MPLPGEIPVDAVIVVASANSTGAAQLAPALAAVTGALNYVQGFDITGGGATSATVVNCTLSNLIGTVTGNYALNCVAGATLGINVNGGLSVRFPEAIPCVAAATAITLTVPTLGTGNVMVSAVLYGYYIVQ